MASAFGPGDRIEARCTRCNDVTGHVIVALVGGEIVKVECRACGSVHKYHPATPRGAVRNKETVCRVKAGENRKGVVGAMHIAPEPVPARETSRVSAAVRRSVENLEQSWQCALNQTAASPKPYVMDGVFVEGDVLEHPVFGLGVVQEIIEAGKVQVLFREGCKRLRCRC